MNSDIKKGRIDIFRSMGFELILIGAVFLFNPIVGVADFLPDIIGWILICVGMDRLRDMCEDMTAAYAQVKRLIIFGAVRLLLMVIVPGMEDKGYSLVFTFIFAVFETGCMVLFFRRFFAGMQFLALRHGSSTVKSGHDDLYTMTTAFCVIRAAFNLLPELKYLSTSDYEGEITAFETFDLANYPTALLVINLFFAGIAGIVWLCMFIPWMRRIIADRPFIESMKSWYISEIGSDAFRFEMRRMKLLTILLGAGFAMQADVFLDGFSYVPDFIGTALIVIALYTVSSELENSRRMRLPALILLPLNIAVWIYSRIIARYYTYNVFRSFSTYYALIGLTVLAAVEAGVTVWLYYEAYRELKPFIRDKCGELDDPRFARLAERKRAMQTGLYRVLAAFAISGAIAAVSGVINYFGLYAFDAYWIVNAVIDLVHLILTYWLFTSIYEQLKVRQQAVKGED